MPIYEYKCPSCRKVFEEWVKAHDTDPRQCPDCGVMSPHIVSNTTFVLKGGGWYVTEYGNRKNEAGSTPSPSSAAPADSADSAGSAAPPAEAGSESAPTPAPAATPSRDAAVSAA